MAQLVFTYSTGSIERSATASAGRVSVLDTGETGVSSVDVLSQPTWGRATVNPDNTVALVLTGTTQDGALTLPCQVHYTNGNSRPLTFNVTVTPITHGDGWGVGRHVYMLETDAGGTTIIEKHPTTFDLYVSASPGAWSKEAIESAEGLGTLTNAQFKDYITGQSKYGKEADPLDPVAGNIVWYRIAASELYGRASHWLHLERGYTYDRAVMDPKPGAMRGLSPLHPMVVTAYGTGTQPALLGRFSQNGDANRGNHNIALVDLHFLDPHSNVGGGDCHMFENCQFVGEVSYNGADDTQYFFGVTFRRCTILDAYKDTPIQRASPGDASRVSIIATPGSDVLELVFYKDASKLEEAKDHYIYPPDPTNASPDYLIFSGAQGLGGNITASVLNDPAGLEVIGIPTLSRVHLRLPVAASSADTGDGGPSWVLDHSVTNWEPNANRYGPLFSIRSRGLTFLENVFIRGGWAPGYDGDENPDAALPQPPSKFSHIVYLGEYTYDVTFADNVFFQGAASVIQLRGGGYVARNFMGDSGDFANVSGGGATNHANFSIYLDNVLTSAGYRRSLARNTVSMNYNKGFEIQAYETVLADNIVCHAADPNNPAEVSTKSNIKSWIGFTNGSLAYDDTVVYNWEPGVNQNIDGLDPAVLDTYTIQRFGDFAKGDPVGTNDIEGTLAIWRNSRANGYADTITAKDAIDWFRTGFGKPEIGKRTVPTTLRFAPQTHTDGMRWDNRLNWREPDGSVADTAPINGDTLELRGNATSYAVMGTRTLAALDLGTGGSLTGSGGKLTVNALSGSGEIETNWAFQVWFAGYAGADTLTLNANGGRMANTGNVTGPVNLAVSGAYTQALLATSNGGDWSVGSGSITITGAGCVVGFDGEAGAAVSLTLGAASTLTFAAGADAAFSPIKNVQSGAFASSVASTVTLGGTLHLDVTGLPNGTHDLILADTVSGTFGAVTASGNATKDLTITIEPSAVRVLVADGAGVIAGGV